MFPRGSLMNRPQLGAHMSTAGGVPMAIQRAQASDCEALQIFTKNSNQWKSPPLSDQNIREFRRRSTGMGVIVSHASYLINLASPDRDLRQRSVSALQDELFRADQLFLDGVVLHPGAYTTSTEADGLNRIAEGVAYVQSRQEGISKLLLEHTAGQGTMLGHRFEHLQTLIEQIENPSRVAICLDTCHLVAAGYDIISESGYEKVFKEFDEILGFKRLSLFHLNDSKKPLGSRIDRHDNIGSGFLGTAPFRRILKDPRFGHLPMVLETPKSGPGKPRSTKADPQDLENLALLRELRDT